MRYTARIPRDILVGLLCSTIVFFFVMHLLSSQPKFVLSLISSLIFFFLYLYLSDRRLQTRIEFSYPDFLIVGLYAFSVASIFFIPALENSVFIEWRCIPFSSYLRAVCAFLISFFLPGYVILRLLDKKAEAHVVETILYSYVISTFFTTLSSFLLLRIGYNMTQTIPIALLAMNAVLLTAYSVRKMRRRTKSISFNFDLISLALILSICIFIMYGIYEINLNYYPLFPGDQWRYFGEMLKFTIEPFSDPVPEARAILYDQIWWPKMLMATFARLSGIPPLNAFIFLTPLSSLPILAFYLIFLLFLEKTVVTRGKLWTYHYSKIPIVATTVSMSMGFGWLYFMSLRMIEGGSVLQSIELAAQRTYDIYITSTLFPFPYIHPTAFLVYPFFLLAMSLPFASQCSNLKKFTLFSITLSTLYLSHFLEFYIAIAILLFLILFYGEYKGILKSGTILISSVVVSVLVVALIDALSLWKIYTISAPFQVLLASIILLINALLLRRFGGRVLPTSKTALLLRRFGGRVLPTSKTALLTAAIYLYGLCFIVWLYIYPDFNVYSPAFDLWTTGVVPWYFYPMRLGITGLLALLVVVAPLLLSIKVPEICGFKFFLLWALVILIMQHFGRGILLSEYRLNAFLWVPLSFFSAYTIVHVSRKITNSLTINHIQKKCVLGLFLVFIILIGTGSQLLKIEGFYLSGFRAQNYRPSVKSFDFLNSLPKNETVFTISHETLELLHSFTHLSRFRLIGGHEYSLLPRSISAPLLFSPDPELFFYILVSHGVRYLYLAPWDVKQLLRDYSSSYIAEIFDHFLMVFEDEGTMIYEVPPFYPPLNHADLEVVVPAAIPRVVSEEFDPTVIADDNQISFWTPLVTGTGTIATPILINDTATKVKGTNSLKMVVGSGTEGAYWHIIHDYGSAQDWSGKDFLCIWWYGGNTSSDIRTLAQTSSGNLFWNEWRDDFTGWKRIVLPFNTFYKVGSPNWSKITVVEVYSGKKNAMGTWHLDRVILDLARTKSVVINCDTTYNWLIDTGSGSLKVDPIDFMQSKGSIKFEGTTDPAYGYMSALYDEPGAWNWSEIKTIELWAKVTSSASPNFCFEASSTTSYIEWWKTIEPNKWTKIILRLDKNDSKSGTWNRNEVNYIRISMRDAENSTGALWIDSMSWLSSDVKLNKYYPLTTVALSGLEYSVDWNLPFNFFDGKNVLLPYDPQPQELNIDACLDWVRNGGRLIILNSQEHSQFANLLGIESDGPVKADNILSANKRFVLAKEINIPIYYTTNNNTRMVAYYANGNSSVSTYTFQMKLSRGEILYLEVAPYFDALKKELSPEIKSKMFLSLGELIEILDLPLRKHLLPLGQIPPPVYWQIHGEITSFGRMRILSDLFFSDYFSAESLSMINDSYELSFHNISITSFLIHGPVEMTVTPQLKFLLSSGFYGLLRIDGNATFKLASDTKVLLTISSKNSTQFISVAGGIINVTSQNILLLVRNMELFIQGRISIKQAFLGWTYTEPYFWVCGKNLQINGSAHIKPIYSSNERMIIKNFTYDGQIKIYDEHYQKLPAEYTSLLSYFGSYLGLTHWETNLPWNRIFTSQYHGILLIVCAILLLIDFAILLRNITAFLSMFYKKRFQKR